MSVGYNVFGQLELNGYNCRNCFELVNDYYNIQEIYCSGCSSLVLVLEFDKLKILSCGNTNDISLFNDHHNYELKEITDSYATNIVGIMDARMVNRPKIKSTVCD